MMGQGGDLTHEETLDNLGIVRRAVVTPATGADRAGRRGF